MPDIRVSVSDAKAQLTELVRRAEAGDDVVLTRHGQPAVRLVAINTMPGPTERRRRLEALRSSAAAKVSAGADAARSPGLPLWRGRPAQMIAVDTSALMAILLAEDQSEACIAELEAAPQVLISAGAMAEALIVAARDHECPLLFVGDDFSRTDVIAALGDR